MAEMVSKHVLIIPYPAQGHLPPLVYLAKLLARHGFIVTLFNVESIHRKMLQSSDSETGLENLRLVGIPFEIPIPDGFDASLMNRDTLVRYHLAMNQLRGTVEELMDTLYPKPFCTVIDYFLLLRWGQDLGEKFQIPNVIYFPGSATWCMVETSISALLSEGDVPITDEAFASNQKLVSYLPGTPPIRPRDLPDYFRSNVSKKEDLMKRCLDKKRAVYILLNSFHELEPDTIQGLKTNFDNRVWPIGPLFPLNSSDTNAGVSAGRLKLEDTDCITWLDQQPPKSVLYISFGSVARISASQFEELARGLEATSLPFLWVIHSHLLLDHENARATEYVMEFEKRLGESKQGIVVSWAPQIQILEHKSVGAFLTHCGWNSSIECVCAGGIPVLGWPCLGEQALNCRMLVEEWGLGWRLRQIKDSSSIWNFSELQVIDRHEIERIIRLAMEENEESNKKREKMRRMKEQAHVAVLEGGSSYAALQNFMDWVRDES